MPLFGRRFTWNPVTSGVSPCTESVAFEPDYEILVLDPIDLSVHNFPVSYWIKARKR